MVRIIFLFLATRTVELSAACAAVRAWHFIFSGGGLP
jgi:hypothetical protein